MRKNSSAPNSAKRPSKSAIRGLRGLSNSAGRGPRESASRSRRELERENDRLFDEMAAETRVSLGPQRRTGLARSIADSIHRDLGSRAFVPGGSANSPYASAASAAAGATDRATPDDVVISGTADHDERIRDGRSACLNGFRDDMIQPADKALNHTHALNDETTESRDDGNHVSYTPPSVEDPQVGSNEGAQLHGIAAADIVDDPPTFGDNSAEDTNDASPPEQTNSEPLAANKAKHPTSKTSHARTPARRKAPASTRKKPKRYDPALVPSERNHEGMVNGDRGYWFVDFCLGVRREPPKGPATLSSVDNSSSNDSNSGSSEKGRGWQTLLLFTGWPEPVWVELELNKDCNTDIAYHFWTHAKQKPPSYKYPRKFDKKRGRKPSDEWLEQWQKARDEAEEKYPELFLSPEFDGKKTVPAGAKEAANKEVGGTSATEAAPEKTGSSKVGAMSSSSTTVADTSASRVPTKSNGRAKETTTSQPVRQTRSSKRKLPASESDSEGSSSGGPPAMKRRYLRPRK